RCGVTYFNMAYDNRIGFDMVTWTYTQVDGKTRTSGAEAFAAYAPLDSLIFMLNYTYTDTEEPDGARLARRPYNKASLTTRYRFLHVVFKKNSDLNHTLPIGCLFFILILF
ncbi:MAG: TonB-dependent receptor, partial [Planctomycetes bacterium]|nr:TonB-dependent receptor [Planctomycetota bacterium]